MLPFLLPILAIGACLWAARHRRASAAAVVGHIAAPPAPSPIAVLCGFIRAGQEPPPPVILCALAEAEATHQPEIADAILHAFIVPVVRGEILTAKNANAVPSPVGADARHRVPLYSKEQAIEREAHAPSQASRSGGAGQAQPIAADESEDEAIARALESARTQGRGGSEMRAAHVAHTSHVTRGEPDDPGAIIGFAPPDAWDRFSSQLAREAPSFSAKRHVGQFRARRDRLAELGIDANRLIDDPVAQRSALAREMADAYARAEDSGLIAEHLGSTIDGATVTLSGILGVIQVAGLEGACAWLERPSDRERHRNTSRMFARTNGVF